jgi:bifunctional non-homologous end joining protein LigD
MALVTDLFDAIPADVAARLRPEQPVPSWRPPMLATLTEDRFSDPKWIFERKFDGIRLLAARDGERVTLRSRNDLPLEATYPEIVDALAAQDRQRIVIDGEVVAFEGRRTSFERLQGRSGIHNAAAARATGISVYYYVFDLLHLDGYDTTGLPQTWRKRLLRKALSFTGPLRFTTHRVGAGVEAYEAACRRGDEGVVAKRADAPYAAGRSPNWLKFKCVRNQEFVVGGYTTPKGSRVALGALLVGYYDGTDLVYAGKVGTGFTESTLRRLSEQLDGLGSKKSPFTRDQPTERDVHWVAPELVAEVGFTEWTRDGKLRHPRYQGLRDDKAASEVVRESR